MEAVQPPPEPSRLPLFLPMSSVFGARLVLLKLVLRSRSGPPETTQPNPQEPGGGTSGLYIGATFTMYERSNWSMKISSRYGPFQFG